MKKFGLALATLCAVIIALPSIAGAQTVVIKRGGGHHHARGARAEMHRGRGFHRAPHHHNRVVVIKKRHRY